MRFAGTYPLACGERVWPLAYPDPKLYASRLLATLWRDAGGRLTGSVREGPAPEGVKPSFELTSPPLADVVRDINKYSNNVMAQQLLLTLALQRPGATRATPEGGREALRQWLVAAPGRVARRRGHRQRLGPVARDAPVCRAAGARAADRRGRAR